MLIQSNYISTEDINNIFRQLTPQEENRAEALIPLVVSSLRTEAKKAGKDLDEMARNDTDYLNVLKSVIVDVVTRYLRQATDGEPLSQFSQSALGYSTSGTFLVAGGGLFIKESEKTRLGLKRQKYGVMDFYGLS